MTVAINFLLDEAINQNTSVVSLCPAEAPINTRSQHLNNISIFKMGFCFVVILNLSVFRNGVNEHGVPGTNKIASHIFLIFADEANLSLKCVILRFLKLEMNSS